MVGHIPSLKMQISTTLILILQEIRVVCILNYALNLGGFFLRELGTQLQFETIQGGIAVYYIMRSVLSPLIDGWLSKARPILTRNPDLSPTGPSGAPLGLHHMFTGVLFTCTLGLGRFRPNGALRLPLTLAKLRVMLHTWPMPCS